MPFNPQAQTGQMQQEKPGEKILAPLGPVRCNREYSERSGKEIVHIASILDKLPGVVYESFASNFFEAGKAYSPLL